RHECVPGKLQLYKRFRVAKARLKLAQSGVADRQNLECRQLAEPTRQAGEGIAVQTKRAQRLDLSDPSRHLGEAVRPELEYLEGPRAPDLLRYLAIEASREPQLARGCVYGERQR